MNAVEITAEWPDLTPEQQGRVLRYGEACVMAGSQAGRSPLLSEIDRLTRELAERETELASIRQLLEDAKAQAVPDVEELTGWIRDLGYTTSRQSETIAKRLHRKLSARPELPKEPSDAE